MYVRIKSEVIVIWFTYILLFVNIDAQIVFANWSDHCHWFIYYLDLMKLVSFCFYSYCIFITDYVWAGVNSKYEELWFSNFYHYIWMFHEHLHVYCLAAVAFLLFFNVGCKFQTEKMWYGTCINNGLFQKINTGMGG